MALALAKECGAHHIVKADEYQVEAVKALTLGKGAEAVIDFVGEGNSIQNGLAMTRNNGGRRIHPDCGEESLAFTTVEGVPLDPSGFHDYLRRVTSVRRNVEFNGFICRSLLEARNTKAGS